MTEGFLNQYQTAEPWAYATPVRRAQKAPPRGDVHVFGVLVVVAFDDGRVLLFLDDAHWSPRRLGDRRVSLPLFGGDGR